MKKPATSPADDSAAATATPDPLPAAEFRMLPLSDVVDSPTNARRHVTGPEFEDLVASILQKGVLEPVLVRPRKVGKGYELVAGHRRTHGARAAGLDEIPAMVRHLEDWEALEIQAIENCHRTNLHPLEEADALHALSRLPGYDLPKVGARIGRPVAWVRERLKLLALTKAAKEMFLGGRFTLGHANELAKLSPENQSRALDVKSRALFEQRWDMFDDDGTKGTALRGLANFKSWIDENVRFDLTRDADPLVFPELAAELAAAAKDGRKVIPIANLNSYSIKQRDRGKGDDHVYADDEWQRADGQKKSKKCAHARLAFVALGPGRGESFEVCTETSKCLIHWKHRIEMEQRKAVDSKRGKSTAEKRKPSPWELKARRDQAEAKRWKKARPQIIAAIAAAIEKASAKPGGPLQKLIEGQIGWRVYGRNKLEAFVAAGTTPEGLVRHLASRAAAASWNDTFYHPAVKVAKLLGVNTKAIVAAAAPAKKIARRPKPKQKTKPRTGSAAKARNVKRGKAA